jgi:hypothetical protein
MDPCNEVQEKLARGGSLTGAERAHAAACGRCLAVAADCSWLDAALAVVAVPVPAGFADRVMARLPELDGATAAASPRWYQRRWAELAFANAAALVTVLNVARFLARVFVSQIAQGGSP